MRRQGWDGWPLTELLLQRQDQVFGQHGDAVFRARAVAHERLAALELDVFDAQPQTFGWLEEKDGRIGVVHPQKFRSPIARARALCAGGFRGS